MRWVLGVALLAVVATASAATSARNATVTITDRGVAPRAARMEPGGRVQATFTRRR